MIETAAVVGGSGFTHPLNQTMGGAAPAIPSGRIVGTDNNVRSLLCHEGASAASGSLAGKNIAVECTHGHAVLESCIARVDHALIDGTWSRRKDFAGADLLFMADLVDMANEKKPGLNLVYLDSPQTLGAVIRQGRGDAGSTRYIVNVGNGGIHFAVIDCLVLNGQASIILFEPASLDGLGPMKLAIQAESSVFKECLPANSHFLIVEMDIQRSLSECGIFSLALGKKLQAEQAALRPLHQRNIQGEFSGISHMSPGDVDGYLPPSLYKHVQGRTRISEYLNANPSAGPVMINKKQQTLLERFNERMTQVDGGWFSRSAHDKRRVELTSLRQFFLRSGSSVQV